MDKNTTKDSGDMGIVFNTSVIPAPKKESIPPVVTSTPIQTSSQSKPPSQKDSNFSNQDRVFDVTKVFSSKHGGDGTVISDRRHRKRSLRQNLQLAFSEWWYTTQRSIDRAVNAVPSVTKLKQEEPTVPDVSSRTDVVKEASSNALIAPQDDHQIVLKQFHTLKSDVDRLTGVPDIAIKEPTIKNTPISAWVHTVTDAPKPKVKIPTPDIRTTVIAPVVSRTTNSASQALTSIPTPIQREQKPALPKGATAKPVVSQVVSPKTTVGLKPVVPETNINLQNFKDDTPSKTEATIPQTITKVEDTPAQDLPPIPPAYAFSGLRVTPQSKAIEKEEVGSWAHLIDDVPEMTRPTLATSPRVDVVSEKVSTYQVTPKTKTASVPAPQKPNIAVDIATKTAPNTIPVPKTSHKQPVEKSVPPIVSQNQQEAVTNIKTAFQHVSLNRTPVTQHPTETSDLTFTNDKSIKTTASPQRTVPHEFSQNKIDSRKQKQYITESSAPDQISLASQGVAENSVVPQAPHRAFVNTRSRETASKDISVPTFSVSDESATQQTISPDILRQSFNAQRAVHTPSVKQGMIAIQDRETSSPERRGFFSQIPMPYIIGGGVTTVSLILVIFGGVVYFSSSAPNAPELSLAPSFFDVSSSVSIPLTEERGTFFASVSERIANSSTRNVQVNPTLKENKKDRSVTCKEFFTTLGFDAPYSFVNSLDETFMLGGITTTKTEPYLIIRSYNFETLFSGLLAWEDSMQSDFAPLFGIPGTENSIFRDAVSDNKSTRILYNGGGNEVLLYSFVNRNTVVITTSGEALAALIKEF